MKRRNQVNNGGLWNYEAGRESVCEYSQSLRGSEVGGSIATRGGNFECSTMRRTYQEYKEEVIPAGEKF